MAGKTTHESKVGAGDRPQTPAPKADQNGPVQTPRDLQRSGSLRLRGEALPKATPTLRRERTVDSLHARRARPFCSTPRPEVARGACSVPHSPATSRRSSSAGHPWEPQPTLSAMSPFSTDGIARNGTTFSSRCNKYVLHCAKRVDDEHYLTPTQRTTRDLRRLRALLDKAHDTIRQKDTEIDRLNQEVIYLRLRATPFQDFSARSAQLSDPASDPAVPTGDLSVAGSAPVVPDSVDIASNDSAVPPGAPAPPQAETPTTEKTDMTLLVPPADDKSNLDFQTPSPRGGAPESDKPQLLPSVCDSGTYDCLTSPSVSSKESADRPVVLELEERLGDDWERTEHWVEWEERRLREESERRVSELNRHHATEYQEMKEKYNDKVEALLQKLTDANNRLFELRPQLDASRLRVGQLELQLEVERCRAARGSSCHQTTQTDPQVALPSEQAEQVAALSQSLALSERELARIRGLYCEQLALLEDSRQSAGESSSLEMDPPMRLQFLRSAMFHFLTDRDDYAGHLRAISAVLQFSEWELSEVERFRARKLSHG